MATSAAGPWTSSCITPQENSSDYVHVRSGHTLNINQNVTIDELVIDVGGTVSINKNRSLTINNGSGTDMTVNGTLEDNGNGLVQGLLISSGGTWQLEANGTIIKTGTSSVNSYLSNYEGGISNIPATANWRYRNNGNDFTVNGQASGIVYPNLYYESTSGDYTFDHPSEVISGSTEFVTVKGNLYIGASGTGAVQVHNINTNATAMQIAGDLIIGGNGSVRSSSFSNHEGSNVGTGINVGGSVLINANGILNFDDLTTATDGIIILAGNWQNLNTGNGFTQGQSTVEFTGGNNQSITKTTGSENFYNVIVDKSAGSITNNASDMVIENNLTLTNGIINTSSSAYLLFEAAATVTGGSTASHINGPAIKETNDGTITNFMYPVGNMGVYRPIGIETRFYAGEFYMAEYRRGAYPDLTFNPDVINHVTSYDYWLLDEFVGGTGEELKVTLYWEHQTAK